jgi:putative Holliday junction resolvase
MRYLGLDLGNRTCGIAVSDPMGIIATSIETVRFSEKNLQKCLEYVKMYIADRKVEKIVMGLPKNMNGTLGPQSEYVLEFKKMLEDETNLEVILYDERLTTIEVQKVMISADVSRNKRKKVVDTLAATLILQSYLDSIR